MVTSANQRPGSPGGDQSEARAVARDASVAVDDVAPVAGAEGRLTFISQARACTVQATVTNHL